MKLYRQYTLAELTLLKSLELLLNQKIYFQQLNASRATWSLDNLILVTQLGQESITGQHYKCNVNIEIMKLLL